MRITDTRRGGRPGYTLIELLVVIAIFAVLMGLIVPAVVKVFGLGPRVQTQTEIRKMHEALQAASQAYNGLDYFPSKLILYNNMQTYKNPPAADLVDAKRTANALAAMFGTRLLRQGGAVNWIVGNTPARAVLEGQQCLVFYLGGVQQSTASGNQCLGFSDNVLDPTNFTNSSRAIGPFYPFASSRLKPAANGNGYFQYIDPYGAQPYAFFGKLGKTPSSYNTAKWTAQSVPGDCPSLGISPYFAAGSNPPQFLNPDTFQIISAGADTNFGAGGGVWGPSTGTGDPPSRDNLTNFSRSPLAAGQS